MRYLFSSSLFLLLTSSVTLQAGNKLSRAAVDGEFAKAKACVAAGEKVNDVDRWGWTALLWAVYYGNCQIADWLLENGADPNFKTLKTYGNFSPGVTPLIFAAYYGHDHAVASLLKKNADPNITDVKGKKAIDYAKEFHFQKCIDLLEPTPPAPPAQSAEPTTQPTQPEQPTEPKPPTEPTAPPPPPTPQQQPAETEQPVQNPEAPKPQ
jgi:hypothetical protein